MLGAAAGMAGGGGGGGLSGGSSSATSGADSGDRMNSGSQMFDMSYSAGNAEGIPAWAIVAVAGIAMVGFIGVRGRR
ncbi:hypothetical protein [Alcanivorax sp.]|uniref:hypothetical protein n=1 Tax=Alcanivorax sp. TaxID=1872427 RepID=UPI0025B97088|nr:hypothetical protein [Alcanivorax sp.]